MKPIITLMLCMGAIALYGQEDGDRSLRAWINQYQESSDIKFSYDPEVLAQIILTGKDWLMTGEELLSALGSKYPLSVDTLDQKYLIIRLTEAVYRFTLSDSTTNTPIDPALTVVLSNGQPLPSKIINNGLSVRLKPAQTDTILLYAAGYDIQPITWHSLINQTHIHRKMEPTYMELADVIIEDYISKGINLNPASQSIDINVASLPLLPGETDGDLFASLVALPGITTPDGRPGNLYVRGSATDQTFILLDHIPIYHKGHYFGTISPYNPKMVEDVKVYRNGFHPRLGGRVGGAVEISSDDAPALKANGGIGTNTLYGMGYFKAPVIENKLGLSIGARRSYPLHIQSPKLKAISEAVFAASAIADTNTGDITTDLDVIFEDYNLKAAFAPSAKSKISVSGIHTRSQIGYHLVSVNRQVPEESKTLNSGVSTQWIRQNSVDLSSSVIVSYSDYEMGFRTGEGERSTHAINQIKDFNIKAEFSKTMENSNQLQAGVEYVNQQVSHDYLAIEIRKPEPTLLNSQLTANTYVAFANLDLNHMKKAYLQLGVRGSYYDLTNKYSVTPRIFANYEVSSNITAKGSIGRYNQFLSQVKIMEFASGGFDNELWRLADGEDHSVITGTQSMLGVLLTVGPWLLDTEAYYKFAEDVTYYSTKRIATNGSYSSFDHQMYGLDFLMKRAISQEASIWAGYSYSKVLVIQDSTDAKLDSKFSQPHVAYIGGSYYKSRWKVSLGWSISSGLNARRSIEFIEAEQSYLTNERRRNPGQEPYNPFMETPNRYAPVHKLDLSVSYTIPKTDQRNWSSSIGLSVLNAYNQVNLTDQVVRANPDTPTPNVVRREAISFAPNLMVSIEW